MRWLLLAGIVAPEGPAPTPLERAFEARMESAIEAGGDVGRIVEESPDLLPALLDRWLLVALAEDPPDRDALERVETLCDRLGRERPSLLEAPIDRLPEWRRSLEAFRAARTRDAWESVRATFERLGDGRRAALAELNLARLEDASPEDARASAASARRRAEGARDAPLLGLAHSIESDRLRDAGRYEEALEASSSALSIHRRLEDRRGEAEDERAIAVARGRIGFSMDRRGDSAGARREVEAAVAGFDRAIRIAEEIGDGALRARVLRGRGSTWEFLGEKSRARADLDAALDEYERLGEAVEAARIHAHYGRALRSEAPGEALDHLRRASRAFEESGLESREAAQCWTVYATVLQRSAGVSTDPIGEALLHFRSAGGVFERLGDLSGLAEALAGEAGILYHRGDLSGAEEAARRSISLSERGDRSGRNEYFPFLVLGGAGYQAGRYEDAERSFDRALEAARRSRSDANVGLCLAWLGDLRAWQRRLPEAEACLAEARPLVADDSILWIEVTAKLAFLAAESGREEEAAPLFDEAERRAHEVGEPGRGVQAILLRAASDAERRPERALRSVRRAREALAGESSLRTEARLAGLEASAHRALGRQEEAREGYLRVLERLREEEDPREMALALLGLVETSLRLDRIDEAREAWREASSAFARLRPAALSEVWQIPLQERFEDLPRLGVEVFVRSGDDEGALEAAQDAQGRALADTLEAGAVPSGGLIERLRARLGEGEAFVAYAEGLDALFAFVVRDEALTRVELGPVDAVADAARAFRESCEAPAPRSVESVRAFAEAGVRLRDLAWAPLAGAIAGCRTLVVAPGARLAGVALEALPLEAPPGAVSFAEIRYAVEAASFAYVPSARVYLALADVSRGRGKGLFAVADPLYGPASADGPVAARGVEGVAIAGAAAGTLPPLPFSREEADGVGRLFGEDERVLRLGAAALPASLAAGGPLDRSRFVLLSVHGSADESDREACGLWLSPEGAGGGAGASFFGAKDLEGRRLLADTVALTSCRTARGVHSSGEGVLSLAREFLRAGARAVLASEWLVSDAATAAISVAFHEEMLRGGLSPAEALRLAKAGYLRGLVRAAPAGERGSPRPRATPEVDPAHPFFWAPFLLFGPPE